MATLSVSALKAISIYILSLLVTANAYQTSGYEMIERHLNVTEGYFSSNVITTGVENANNPDANTYCIIGDLDLAEYLQNEGYYEFILIYKYSDGQEDVLEWTQTSWLTDGYVTGADLSKITDSYTDEDGHWFRGLALSSTTGWTYLDGNGKATGDWWHAVASIKGYHGGIPAHEGKIAYSSELWVRLRGMSSVHACDCLFLC